MSFVRHVLGQVVSLVVRRLDRIEILVEPGLILRCLTGEESIEVIKTMAGGPAVERSHRGRLGSRRVMPLAEGSRPVAVVM